jgi:hypothetical protein
MPMVSKVAKPISCSLKVTLIQAVTSANFREDLDANGQIKKPDVQIVQDNKGHSIP